jgi:hypothetical protein
MRCNVGTADRIVRIVLGLALLVPGIFAVQVVAWKWVLIVIGALALVTGLSGRCGIYMLFRVSTCKSE